ncbi:hypothetical protein [Clostridium sp. BJN0001]|uniref:hypothetical protein n=1 Tax=Clostridium sp. BJN0001 TaxID=2930219 RepID=UPI001FD0D84F|nr:hypothetical protein [Clostridium sp. BJN0001]
MDEKVMTLEAFKAKAIDKYRKRKLVADILVKGFGKVKFKRPTDEDLLEYLNGAAKGAKLSKDGEVKETDVGPIADAAKILVYKTCPFLHDSELQKEIEATDPYDAPFKVFGLTETMSLAEKISDEFNSEDIQEDIKNS